MDGIRAAFARAGLVRPQNGRWLAGVCVGVGQRLGVDAWILRLILVLLVVLPGPSVIIYAGLWLCMPPQGWIAPPRTT